MRRRFAAVFVFCLLLGGLSWSSAQAAPGSAPPASDAGPLAVYAGTVDASALAAIGELGVDRHALKVAPVAGAEGQFTVEVILSGDQAEALSAEGATLTRRDSASARQLQAGGVFRMYSGPGGLQEELIAQAAAHPAIAQLQVIGKTVNGQDINAVRVTKDPGKTREGRRPTAVYVGAQHAREWITPEMVRRLLHHYLTGYGTDRQITAIVDTTELWFIPVANPDGYDFTFEGERLWRKNLRDNNGDGQIAAGDGVDLNRNFPTRWGYDNEGSSPNPGSETYRGPSPASEPETQALDRLFRRITPEFLVNYHSAAELLLYGIGWQVATPSPDDVLYESMAGNDVIGSAIPGYDPDISAELYTTNGDTDSHMQEAYGTLGFTPEMSTCEVVSDRNPEDEWEAEDCESGFDFPDDEALIQEEFEKNIPFALAVAESADDPDDPVSVVGIDSPDMVIDPFEVSFGDPQQIAVTAKRALRGLRLEYRINDGRVRHSAASEWRGGERYGFENKDYYAEYRGTIRTANQGDEVEVWFSAVSLRRRPRRQSSRRERALHLHRRAGLGQRRADHRERGLHGRQSCDPTPSGAVEPKYVDEHVAAFQANGITPDVWDVDAQGVPHHLGVLSHYETVLWYLGDNRLTQDPGGLHHRSAGFGAIQDSSVAERAQYLTHRRSRLSQRGRQADSRRRDDRLRRHHRRGARRVIGGIYYALDDVPEQQCAVMEDLFGDCLLLANDFRQYYLGAWNREALAGAAGIIGTTGPTQGDEATFGGPATADNPIDEPGAFTLTSELLPPDQFPQFAGTSVLEYTGVAGTVEAIEGELAAVANHADEAYMRLGRTFDLTAIGAEEQPRFQAQLAWSTEAGYDHVIVEAHTVGQDDWTTLPTLAPPDSIGQTQTGVPTECSAGFYIGLHPNLSRYLTLGNPCVPARPGSWNSFTGDSNGFRSVAFDLTAYAGQQVEIVVSYVTDQVTGENGVALDDTRLTTTTGSTQVEGFEAGLGAWQVLGPPGAVPNPRDWVVAEQLGDITAGVATEDTLLLGFGIEQLESPAARAELVADALELLGG